MLTFQDNLFCPFFVLTTMVLVFTSKMGMLWLALLFFFIMFAALLMIAVIAILTGYATLGIQWI